MISKFENCGHSPAWPLIPEAMLELENSGLGFQPSQPPFWNDPCLIWKNELNEVKGFLAYRPDELDCSWFILLAYVTPDMRRNGVHTSLFEALVMRAESRGDILSIRSGTHVDNIAAQSSFEKQGRKKIAVMYKYTIREWLEGKPFIDEAARNE